jgi:excinuclease UvrABC nuclease subunit
MESAIHKQNFEWAAKLRDIYRKIEGMTQQQTVVLQTPYTGYIASITPLQKKWVRVLLQIQKGKLADVFRDITAQEDIDEASVKTMLELQSGSLKKKGNLYLSHLNPGIANEEQEQIIQLIERIRQ